MDKILAQIAQGEIAAVYLLAGESYPLEQVVQALRKAVVGGGDSAFNLDVLQAGEAKVESVLALAKSVPMFGDRRLVQVRDVHLWSAADFAKLVPYAQRPVPNTCLLLIAEKFDARVKAVAEIKRHGVVERFEPLKDRGVPAWVQSEARRMNVKLAPGTAERIGEVVGTDMAELSSALERLSLYAGVGATVDAHHVDELLAKTRQHSIFELTNAVGRGERADALRLLQEMIDQREPGLRILAMISRHLRQLWSIAELAARGLPAKEIAGQVGVHPFFVDDLVKQAKRFNGRRFRRMHGAIYFADRQLKSSRLGDTAIMNQLVFHLCEAE